MSDDTAQDQALTPTKPKSRWTSWLKLVVLLAIVGGVIFFVATRKDSPAVQARKVKTYFRTNFDPVTQRLIYVGFYVVGTIFLLPGTALSYAGASLFGAYEGTLYTWIGATIGATLAFLWSRMLGGDFVDRLFGGRFASFEERMKKHGFTGLLLVRFFPIFPFNGVNFGCGLTKIRFRDYVLATAIGILPGTFVYQFLFAKFDERILKEGVRARDFLETDLLLALGLFVVFLIVVTRLTKRLQKRTETPSKKQKP